MSDIISSEIDSEIESEVSSFNNCHMYWARLLLLNILKNNGYTKYEHTSGPIYWGPCDNKQQYTSVTDCSGFINALIRKTYGLPINWLGKKRPYAATYYEMINLQNYFIKITNVWDAKVGDFIVFINLVKTSKNDNTGHIMIINKMPMQIKEKRPYINNTIQWIINIIDQSSNAHGRTDTRYTNKSTGLGNGNLRIYTDYSGNIQGYTWSTESYSQYIDKSMRPLVIGRLDI